MSFGGFIGNLISGGGSSGYGDMSNQIQQGINALNQQYGSGQQVLQPWEQQGLNAFGQYGSAINGMSNPSQFYSNIMNQYQMSPAAQFQEQQGQQAMNQASAASGTLGSGGAQKALDQYSQGVASQDQNQYFGNVMGINNQYLGGLQNQYGTGFGAANALNENYMGLGNQLAAMYGNLGESQLGGQSSMYGGLQNLIGMGAASGPGQQMLGGIGNFVSGLF